MPAEELLLAAYDELDAVRRGQLQEHLRDCARCRQEFARLGATLALLRPAPLDCSGVDLQRFSARLHERIGRRRLAGPRLRLATAALALVVLAFIAPWQGDVLRGTGSMPPAAATAELGMLEALDFYQNLEVLELLDLFAELEPLG
jgi:anti-sigma factor RsiW